MTIKQVWYCQTGKDTMETILREFRNLPNEQYGKLVKLIFNYVDTKEIDGDIELVVYFNYYVKNKVDYLLKQRQRTNKNTEVRKHGKPK